VDALPARIDGHRQAPVADAQQHLAAMRSLKPRHVMRALRVQIEAPHRLAPTHVEDSPPLGMDLTNGEIRTILWATGYHPDYSWLYVPVLDRKGHVRHDGGITPSPGLYLMGMQFLRRRKSALIDGAGDDARDLSAHLASYLAHQPH